MKEPESPSVVLKPGRERSLRSFHPWVFSGGIQETRGAPEEGDVVDVLSSEGAFLATGHYSRGSITIKVLSFSKRPVDQAFWTDAFRRAHALRTALGLTASPATNAYRLVNGEGDGLPGLIVDVYGSAAIIQCHSAGMVRSQPLISHALQQLFGQTLNCIYARNRDTIPPNWGRQAKETEEVLEGSLFGQATSGRISENGHVFKVDWAGGQKTGFYLDQRENRRLVGECAAGRRVFDGFCYSGGFTVYALAGGAAHVDAVDASAKALDLLKENVALNIADGSWRSIRGDCAAYLSECGRDYDLIILDPPGLAKHASAVAGGLRQYRRLNRLALEKIRPGGLIFTFSCSQLVGREKFLELIRSEATQTGRRVSVIRELHQAPCHAVSLFHPEGVYLKGFLMKVD
jgi:23S rRNA (cytosine1962-C5)-methyltransferase